MRQFEGFTLVELLVVLAIMGIVFSLAGTMLVFSMRSHDAIEEEFEIQSSMRLASQIVVNYIRESSAMFMLNSSQFDNDNLKNEWDYFGLSPDRKQVIQYKWNSVSSTHDPIILADSYPGIVYSLAFHKSDNDSLLGGFSIQAVTEAGHIKVGIDNEINAVNTVVVDNTGNSGDPAVALA